MDKIIFIILLDKQTSINAISPFIEKLKQDGYNVLYFIDPIDEYMVQSLNDYKEKN